MEGTWTRLADVSYLPNTYQLCLSDGSEVGRSHSRSFGIMGKKHTPYLEFNDDPSILDDLDEIVAIFVYVEIRREKDIRASAAAPVSVAS